MTTDSGIGSHNETIVIGGPGRRWSLGLHDLWQYRAYLEHLLQREIKGRYRPTTFGHLWLFIRPLLEMLVYALVFGVLLGITTSGMPYPLFLYSGLIVWIFVQNSVARAASSLSSSRGLMDKIYFPRVIIPAVQIGANALDLLMAGLVIVGLVLYYALVGPILFGTDPYVPDVGAALFALPVFVIMLFAFVVATSLLMAAWQVHSVDVGLVLPVALRLAMYLSPVVYPLERVPAEWRDLYLLNPVAIILEGMRWSLFGTAPPPLAQTVFALVLTATLLLIALVTFRRVERTMVDML